MTLSPFDIDNRLKKWKVGRVVSRISRINFSGLGLGFHVLKKAELQVAEVKLLVKLRIY